MICFSKIERHVISPSVKTCGFDTFLIRGRQELRIIEFVAEFD